MKKMLALLLSFSVLLTSNAIVFAEDTNGSATNEAEETVETKQDGIVSYLAIANPSVAKGQSVSIVVGVDSMKSIDTATLCVTNTDLNCDYYIDGRVTEDGNLVFESDTLESGCYSVTSIMYSVGGKSYTELFNDMGLKAQFGVDTLVIDDVPDAVVTDEEMEKTESVEEDAAVIVDDKTTSEYELSDSINSVIAAQGMDLYGTGNSTVNVVLDPGHGGHDGGATRSFNGKTYLEKELNLKIAKYCKEELETYSNVKVYMTRSDDTFVGLEDRVNYAKSVGATVFVSIHNNSSESSGVHGATVYYPNSNYKPQLGTQGQALAQSIVAQLVALGLANHGAVIRNSESGDTYEDGSLCDYYSVIRNSKKAGFPGLIIEHAYISNANDAATYLGSEAALKKLGVADANGIVNYFGLTHAIPGTEYQGVNYQLIFDPVYYMNNNQDVKNMTSGNAQKALEHFVTYGMKEGRQGRAEFDIKYYRNKYYDLQRAYGSDNVSYYMHYMNRGVNEGRQACEQFDVLSYKARYADLRNSYGNDLKKYVMHYILWGKNEGRDGSPNTNKYNVQFIQNGKVIDNQQVEFGHAAQVPENIEKKNGATIVYDKAFNIVTSDMVINVDNRYLYNNKDYTSIFDADYYLNKYSDVQNAFGKNGTKALEHFVTYGMKEGRQGNETFDVYSYRGRYKDLRNAFSDNIKAYYNHYLDYGIKEHRDGSEIRDSYSVKFTDGKKILSEQNVKFGHAAKAPTVTKNGATISWGTEYDCITSDVTITLVRKYIYDGIDYSDIFNPNYYLSKYGDLKKAFGNDGHKALAHFVTYGMKEGRQASDTFSVMSYKNRYYDLRRTFGNDLKRYYIHYINYGKREGRVTTGFEQSIVNAQTVYNGVDYSSVYDFNYYVSKNADVLRTFGYDENKVLEHFVVYGMKEGRQAKETFNLSVYKNNYYDLRKAYRDNNKAYYMHFITYGQKENRKAA